MSKWTLKRIGGVVEDRQQSNVSAELIIPPNTTTKGITYTVKYEDNEGNGGETTINQLAGNFSITITDLWLELPTQQGDSAFLVYDNEEQITVKFKYTIEGLPLADVDDKWFKFGVFDKNNNQISLLIPDTLDRNNTSGTTTIYLNSLDFGIPPDCNHTIISYTPSPHDTRNIILPDDYYTDPDDKMRIYYVLLDGFQYKYNILNQPQFEHDTYHRKSNVFLTVSSEPQITSISNGLWVIPQSSTYQPYYSAACDACRKGADFNVKPYHYMYGGGIHEMDTLNPQYNVAGTSLASKKTVFQVFRVLSNNSTEDELMYEFEVGYDATSPVTYGCQADCVAYQGTGISFGTVGAPPNTGTHKIYICWKDDKSIRSNNIIVDTTPHSYMPTS